MDDLQAEINKENDRIKNQLKELQDEKRLNEILIKKKIARDL
tara:strand:- start:131 stop:256 length:126 start_codon:yes stop_codon:yes gene_type:complete